MLFVALVLSPLKLPVPADYRIGRAAIQSLKSSQNHLWDKVSLIIHQVQLGDENKYWGLATAFDKSSVTLSFIDFVQWFEYDCSAYRYVRCLIEGGGEMAGREDLIELHKSDFVFERTDEFEVRC